MSEPLFDEKTFFGVTVNTRLFWIIFTLMMVFFTSPLAHLPYFLGYGELLCIAVGLFAVVLNVLIPLWVAHRSWEKSDKSREDTVY
ncbi:MAG: hypothetical protein ABEK50_13830 [bacterium]